MCINESMLIDILDQIELSSFTRYADNIYYGRYFVFAVGINEVFTLLSDDGKKVGLVIKIPEGFIGYMLPAYRGAGIFQRWLERYCHVIWPEADILFVCEGCLELEHNFESMLCDHGITLKIL